MEAGHFTETRASGSKREDQVEVMVILAGTGRAQASALKCLPARLPTFLLDQGGNSSGVAWQKSAINWWHVCARRGKCPSVVPGEGDCSQRRTLKSDTSRGPAFDLRNLLRIRAAPLPLSYFDPGKLLLSRG